MHKKHHDHGHPSHVCKKKLITPLVVTLIIFLGILTISSLVGIVNKVKEGRYIGQTDQINSISISETGEVLAAPDLGVITVSVITEKKTVASAMSENAEKMNEIIKVMKEEGIADKDLKTTSFNIYPRYDYTEDCRKRVLSGYEVNQALQVKIRDLDKVGTVIQEATDSGANNISQLQLTIDDEEALKEEAREQAIEKAKAKAKTLTSQLGVKLGKVISFNENLFSPYYGGVMYEDSALGGKGGAPDIQGGENKISVSVNIVYEIY